MMSLSSATAEASAMLESGKLANLAEAHIAIVRMMGVRIITGTVPRDARAALNAGVKSGQLGRLPKKGLLPEAYFHPTAKATAVEQRQKIATASIDALKKVLDIRA